MVLNVEDLLKELGWADGFHIPVASEENEKLEKEVEELLRRKADLIISLEAVNESVNASQTQLTVYEEEQNENQKLILQRQQQLENGRNRMNLIKAEYNKRNQDIKDSEKQNTIRVERQSELQCDVNRLMKKLNKLKSKVEWGEEAILMWKELMARGDDDACLMEKIYVEDEVEFKRLELQRQKLMKDVMERQDLLKKVMGEKNYYQMQLQQNGKIYRKAYRRYKTLLRIWNAAVVILQSRDDKIKKCYKRVVKTRKEAIEKLQELQENQKFTEQQARNNTEVDLSIKQLQMKQYKGRLLLMKTLDENYALHGELKVLQNSMADLGSTLMQKRSEVSVTSSKLEDLDNQQQEAYNVVQSLTNQLRCLRSEAMSQMARNNRLEEIYQATVDNHEKLSVEVEKLIDLSLTQKTQLEQAREKARLRMIEIKTCRSATASLVKQGSNFAKEIMRQQEIYYNSKFDLQKLTSKISQLEGEKDLDLKEMLQNKIKELESVLREKTDAFMLVNNQVKYAEQDLRKFTIEVEKGEEELKRLTDGRQDRVMLVEGGQKLLKQKSNACQQLQVELNLLQLRISQAEKVLLKEGDYVFSLEKERLEIETAMKERRVEIGAQRDILLAQKRAILEEKSEVKHSLDHLTGRIIQVQKRYEIAMDMLGKTEEGDQASMTHCKIKLAQEKNELQEKGDTLDTKIRTVEKEILAMENTLKLVNSTNHCYKQNLHAIDADSPEMEQKRQLQEQYYQAMAMVREKRHQLDSVYAAIKEIEMSVVKMSDQEEAVQSEWRTKDSEVRDLDKELGDQQGKLQRAEKQLQKVMRDVHLLKEKRISIAFAERDIETREMQDVNNSALLQLADLATRYLETGPVVSRYLAEKNLSLTTQRMSTTFSSSSLSLPRSGSEAASSRLDSEQSWVPSIVNLDPLSITAAASGQNFNRLQKKSSLVCSSNRKKTSK